MSRSFGTTIDNARAALHILLFLVLPESPDMDGEDIGSARKGDITGWFPFWGLVLGIFMYGLALVLIRILSFQGLDQAGQLVSVIIPIVCMAFLSPTFAAWFGTPRGTDGLAAAVSGEPGVSGIVVLIVVLVISFLFEANLLPMMIALLFFAGTIIVSLAVPHLMSLAFGGTTGILFALSSIIVGVAQLVFFVILVV